MSLCNDYICIIRDYILSHPEDISFKTPYYFLIDYKNKKVIECFDTELSLEKYHELVSVSENYDKGFNDTFQRNYANSNNDNSNIMYGKKDELRELEKEFLQHTKFYNEEIYVADCKTAYRYILMSYVILGLKRNNGRLWFTDQELIIYRLGDAIVREKEYFPKYEYISPFSYGTLNQRFWYSNDKTVLHVLKKLRYNIKYVKSMEEINE